ncbi:MAG: high-affinity Fe2+ transport protein [Planctomycetes bacterium SCN 63-9]|nr:MAG: high-affinity Fe2+ transport protein [Planctomycetes bacterium SCN 63-9]
MSEKSTGRLVMALVGVGVLLFLALNLNLKGRNDSDKAALAEKGTEEGASAEKAAGTGPAKPAGFREYPIGDEVSRNEIRIAAVWLPPILMEGMPDSSSDLIHVEADIHATEGNRNGFAKDEFVPYLKVSYEVHAADGGAGKPPIASGPMVPMVARDGLHYGANISMPKAGTFKLIYHIEPPSAGGLGRHADPATGVDPWWKPFDVSFDWDYAGLPKSGE